jgi:hypothetical protein
MFIGTPPFTFSKHGCYIWNVYQTLASLLIVASVDYVLILRGQFPSLVYFSPPLTSATLSVFALYPRNRFVRYLLQLVYLLEIITISVAVGLAVPGLEYDELCVVVSAPVTFLVAA